MSVLSDISSKLTQAHSADSEKQRVADYSEAFGYLLADLLNKNSSLINPFIRKGAQRRLHFNELDQVEQEKEELLDYREKQPQIAIGATGDGGKSSGESGGIGGPGGGLMGGLAAIFGRKIMGGVKGVAAKGQKAVGSLTEIVGKVIKKVMPRAAARMAAGAGAGAFLGPGGILAVEAGLLAYTLYDVVDELKKELTGSGLFDGFDITSIFPSMDSINESFDSVLEKFASFGKSAASSVGDGVGDGVASASKSAASSVGDGVDSVLEKFASVGSGVASSITGESDPPAGPGGESYSAQPTSVPRKSQSTDIGVGAQDFDALKGVIGQAESDAAGGYDAVVSNKKTPKPPTEMTVGEVLQWQRDELADPKNSGRIDVTAIGKYQIINKTLKGLVDAAGISMSDKFDAETQDKLYMELLKGAGLNDYMDGTISKDEFAHNISKVWAGLPKDEGGKSYYGKDGFNKAHVSWDAVMKAIPDREYVQASINSREEAKAVASEQAGPPVEAVDEYLAEIKKPGDNPTRARQMQAQYDQPVYSGIGADAATNGSPVNEDAQATINSREGTKVIASEQAAVGVTAKNQIPVIISADEVNKPSTDIQKSGKSGDNPTRARQIQAQYDQPVYRGSGPGVINRSTPQPARSQESSFSLLQTVEKMLGY